MKDVAEVLNLSRVVDVQEEYEDFAELAAQNLPWLVDTQCVLQNI